MTYTAFLAATNSGGLGLGLGLGGLLGLLSGGRSSLLGFGLLGLLSLSGGRCGLLLLGLLGLLSAFVLLAAFGCATELNLDEVLSNGDGVFFANEELLDSTSLRGVNGDIDLEEMLG